MFATFKTPLGPISILEAILSSMVRIITIHDGKSGNHIDPNVGIGTTQILLGVLVPIVGTTPMLSAKHINSWTIISIEKYCNLGF